MSEGASVENPEWLYFAAIAESVPRYSNGDVAGIYIHDRVPEIARASADALRALAIPSRATQNRTTGQIGVLARPHGQSPSLRTNPDNPANRKALRKLLERGTLRDPDPLWYIPGWVLDAFLVPQMVTMPSWSLTFVDLWGSRRGAPFVFGGTDAVPTVIRRQIPERSRAQVLVVASPTLAPRIIRPGTVLDAYCVERRGATGLIRIRDDDSERLAQTYVGQVLSELPDHVDRHPLPGEPVKNVVEFINDRDIIKLNQKGTEESRGTPGFVSASDTGDSVGEPLFAQLKPTAGPSRPQSREIIVFEQVGRDTGLGGEEVRP